MPKGTYERQERPKEITLRGFTSKYWYLKYNKELIEHSIITNIDQWNRVKVEITIKEV